MQQHQRAFASKGIWLINLPFYTLDVHGHEWSVEPCHSHPEVCILQEG